MRAFPCALCCCLRARDKDEADDEESAAGQTTWHTTLRPASAASGATVDSQPSMISDGAMRWSHETDPLGGSGDDVTVDVAFRQHSYESDRYTDIAETIFKRNL